MKVEINNQHQIIVATRGGESNIPKTIELINAAVKLAKSNNYNSILFDFRELHGAAEFLEMYEFNKNLTTITDLSHDYKCAVVFTSDHHREERMFYETVSSNWGQGIFKVFFDMELAVESLLLEHAVR